VLHVSIDEGIAGADAEVVELLTLNQALDRLAQRDARLARIVEYRFFGGMAEAEIAEALGLSTRTIERDWKRARAYLFQSLQAIASAEPCS
jgi:DNA-directed RNA polymerase specialized sigma24 family protein